MSTAIIPFHSPLYSLIFSMIRQLQEYGEQVLGVRFDSVSLPDATEAAIRSVEEFVTSAAVAAANQQV